MVYTFGMSTTNLVDIVASNIRAESARRGVVQSDIANALGVQQGTISRRWRGGRAWPLEDLPTVADVLGVSVAYLVTDNSDGTPSIELRPRQDSNLQPRDWSVITNLSTAASRHFANSDPECELIAAA